MYALSLFDTEHYVPEVTKVRLVEARSTPKTCRKRREIKKGGKERKKNEEVRGGREWERE